MTSASRWAVQFHVRVLNNLAVHYSGFCSIFIRLQLCLTFWTISFSFLHRSHFADHICSLHCTETSFVKPIMVLMEAFRLTFKNSEELENSKLYLQGTVYKRCQKVLVLIDDCKRMEHIISCTKNNFTTNTQPSYLQVR